MVVTKLYGGLGNQMFQYAAGLGLSARLKTSLVPDISWFEEMKTNPHIISRREFELDIFDIKPRAVNLFEKINLSINKPTIFCEKSAGFQSDFNNLSGNVILDGHWQSSKYFKQVGESVIDRFTFPATTIAKNKLLLKEIGGSQSVSVHIRRGDYASNKETNRDYGLMPPSYYEAAAKLINKLVGSPRFYLFSDDIEWCQKNLRFGNDMVYISNNKGLKSYEDMRLMAACKHNIIANSSFSWWGAWLNQNSNKQVYAPKKWANKQSLKNNDLIPETWIKL